MVLKTGYRRSGLELEIDLKGKKRKPPITEQESTAPFKIFRRIIESSKIRANFYIPNIKRCFCANYIEKKFFCGLEETGHDLTETSGRPCKTRPGQMIPDSETLPPGPDVDRTPKPLKGS